MPTFLPIIAAGICCASAAAAQDVAYGRALAEQHCVRCHDIDDGGAMKTYPPSFDSISIFRSRDQIESRIALSTLHSPMPDWGSFLDREQIRALTDYVVSLE